MLDVAATPLSVTQPGQRPELAGVRVYDASVALQAGETVSQVVLPDVSSEVASGTSSVHIIAVTIQ